MTSLERYQLERMLRRSIWPLPVLAIGAALLVAPLIRWVDGALGWSAFNLSPEGARSILSAFTSSMLTFVVFVVSSMLIVVQLASAQLTPRIISIVFADRRIRWVLSAFAFAYTYTIAASGRIDNTTPQLTVALAIVCNLACIALFLWFGQWLGGSLRPISVLCSVAEEARAVVESVYPEPFDPGEEPAGPAATPDADALVVEHIGTSGVVLAFSRKNLLTIAERANAVVELVPQVGDFIARGDPLFRVSGSGRSIGPGALRGSVAVGPERTMEQDPRFAFRIMVDIANKALSPAINDPTTAVLALDQIHRLLMYVGQRRLDTGETLDSKGRVRLRYRTPNWSDFVSLAVAETRHFGASSMQVARRLRAMLDHLLRVLPEARRPALQQELSMLERATERGFPDAEDRARAAIGDLQGVGSSMVAVNDSQPLPSVEPN